MNCAGRQSMMAGKRLPYDAEVEYLESTGTQWIDTGVITANDVGCSMHIVEYSKRLTITEMFFGVYGPSSTGTYGLGCNNANKWFLWWNGAPVGPSYSGEFSNRTVSLNFYNSRTYDLAGIFAGTLDNVLTNINVSLTLLSAMRGDTGVLAFNPMIVKFGRVVVTKGSAIVRDLIPVRFTNELGVSEGAMYDRANPTVGMNRDGTPRNDGLYLNRGTGAFVIGPDL